MDNITVYALFGHCLAYGIALRRSKIYRLVHPNLK